jgi:hypothetical protein
MKFDSIPEHFQLCIVTITPSYPIPIKAPLASAHSAGKDRLVEQYAFHKRYTLKASYIDGPDTRISRIFIGCGSSRKLLVLSLLFDENPVEIV